ncbi:hypothetical protein Q4557_19660 [Shewanella sp. 5_MG-2023]|uniref:hypothetical protein n=1 Tax=Shewanella sp. 5_MG-2023 TaxID=3062656 RepID=UPI0026E1A904|nr:hypothetical protein [Shewanella sp. 5_MG-2023]MDO6642164.1 hypothetical protein [Shewanella sp. 5_MG-2023]
MVQYSTGHIIKPKSWEEFEEISRDAMGVRWSNPDLIMHGRPGQAQNGIDIYGNNHIGFVGIQCKNTLGGVTEKVILDEIIKAESFSKSIQQLYIATTAPRDKNTQEFVRDLSEARSKEKRFEIQILFWDDIIQDLVSEPRLFLKHYPQCGGAYNSNKEKVDLINEIYSASCRLLDDIRRIFPFYGEKFKPTELRSNVKSLLQKINDFSSEVKQKKLMLPDELVEIIFDFIESISHPVNIYYLSLTVYEDHELHTLDDVKEDSWKRISESSYGLHDMIKNQMKLLLKTN